MVIVPVIRAETVFARTVLGSGMRLSGRETLTDTNAKEPAEGPATGPAAGPATGPAGPSAEAAGPEETVQTSRERFYREFTFYSILRIKRTSENARGEGDGGNTAMRREKRRIITC